MRAAAVAAATGLPRRAVYARALALAGRAPMKRGAPRAPTAAAGAPSCCACGQLRCRGYRILARRYRVPAGEIDLIARRGRVLAAIEVKARADFDAAGAGGARRASAAASPARSSISSPRGPISPRSMRAST